MGGRKITSDMSPFITKILNELSELRAHVDLLEDKVAEIISGSSSGSEEQSDVSAKWTGEYAAGFENARLHAISAISEIAMARRAIYGYAMLLDEMGLPKDQRELVRHIESTVSSLLRLMQTVRMAEYAMEAFEAASGPIGWLYLVLAGGTLAGAMVYGGRAMGG